VFTQKQIVTILVKDTSGHLQLAFQPFWRSSMLCLSREEFENAALALGYKRPALRRAAILAKLIAMKAVA
jgi:hypothetical protein